MSKDPKLTSAITFYGMIFKAQNKTILDTATYQRFYKVPSLISIAVTYVLAAAWVEFAWLNQPDWHWVPLAICYAGIIVGGLVVGSFCGKTIGAHLGDARVRAAGFCASGS